MSKQTQTPYRLIGNIIEAESIGITLEYHNRSQMNGVWYMTQEEYSYQMMRPNSTWQIRNKQGHCIPGYFDDAWYESNSNNK